MGKSAKIHRIPGVNAHKEQRKISELKLSSAVKKGAKTQPMQLPKKKKKNASPVFSARPEKPVPLLKPGVKKALKKGMEDAELKALSKLPITYPFN